MKKLLFFVFAACAMSSCNFIAEKSDLYKSMVASRDSLQNEFDVKNQEAQEFLSIINEVEENFAQIKEAEEIITISNATENSSEDLRARVGNDVSLIKDLLQKNKEKIAELEEKMNRSQGQLGGLRATINRLKADIEAKDAKVAELEAAVVERDAKIKDLDSTVVVLNENVSSLTAMKEQAEGIVSEQDKELHTAYYYTGTRKQLKNDNIIVKANEYNKSKFTQIDIRDVKEIALDSKVGVLLSRHPFSSYEFKIGDDKKATLVIKNQAEFWSMSKYLIVLVK